MFSQRKWRNNCRVENRRAELNVEIIIFITLYMPHSHKSLGTSNESNYTVYLTTLNC